MMVVEKNGYSDINLEIPVVLGGTVRTQGHHRHDDAFRGYAAKVLSTAPANLIAYWPLWEAPGTTTITDISGNGRNGAYTGVTLGNVGIGDGNVCPSFDGSNDYGNVYTTSLRDAFDGTEGTMTAWAKVNASAVWTDSTYRSVVRLLVDANNYVDFLKSNSNNLLQGMYRAGGTSKNVNVGSLSDEDWMHWAISWSITADAVKIYKDGTQQGSTQTSLGTWAGSLASTTCCIGSSSTVPATVWDGYIAHIAVWTTPLAAAQIANLAVR